MVRVPVLLAKSNAVIVSVKVPSEVQLNNVADEVRLDKMGVPKLQPGATKVIVAN